VRRGDGGGGELSRWRHGKREHEREEEEVSNQSHSKVLHMELLKSCATLWKKIAHSPTATTSEPYRQAAHKISTRESRDIS
jgi:hypothetical protein